jgi:hypothetical protein
MRFTVDTGDMFISDNVEVCEPEPCVFLAIGGFGTYVVTLKPDADSLPAIREKCRPTMPDDMVRLARARKGGGQ